LNNLGKKESKGGSRNLQYSSLVKVPVINIGPRAWGLGSAKGSVDGGCRRK